MPQWRVGHVGILSWGGRLPRPPDHGDAQLPMAAFIGNVVLPARTTPSRPDFAVELSNDIGRPLPPKIRLFDTDGRKDNGVPHSLPGLHQWLGVRTLPVRLAWASSPFEIVQSSNGGRAELLVEGFIHDSVLHRHGTTFP